MASSRLSELSQAIAQNTAVVEQYYQQHGLPMPSFEVGGPIDTTMKDPFIERARIAAVEASIELRDLLEGPTMLLRPVVGNSETTSSLPEQWTDWDIQLNATSLQAIYTFNLPAKVPNNGDISYEDLAKSCNVQTDELRRIIRFGIAHHRIFQEKREGYVSHSAASKLLADSKDAMAGVGTMFDVSYRGFARTIDAIQMYPRQTPTQCGWALAHSASIPIWEFNAQSPEKRDRSSRAMRQFARGFGHETTSLLQGWDWYSLNERAQGGLIVDLGGANGHASVLLARRHPNLRFEVQDLPSVIEAAEAEVPSELRNRVTLKAHNFKQPQPTTADVYLLRQILHDWPDSECVTILRALIPALKPGARIVLNDTLVTPPGTASALAERHLRAIDLIVMTIAGARERNISDWKRLFNEADPRFTQIAAFQPASCCMAIIEATWIG